MEINKIYQGDSLSVLKTFPDESVDCLVTSPPFWALRDYGVEGQLGLEKDYNLYITKLCDIFDEVKRVLKKTGTCWVNLGDTYGTKSGSGFANDNLNPKTIEQIARSTGIYKANELRGTSPSMHKNLCNIPARFSIEMQNRGWILRNKIIWYKPNCMPSSVKDRFTVDFEEIFFFVKSKKYYFETQREDSISSSSYLPSRPRKTNKYGTVMQGAMCSREHMTGKIYEKRNKRCVWEINTKPYKEAHFATYPEALIEPCIKAGCPANGIVLDPFFGAGTTGVVAKHQQKNYIGIELNSLYIELAERRIQEVLL